MKDLDKVYAEKIAEEYAQKEGSAVSRLQKLDKKVKNTPLIFSLSFGIIGALILGIGLCLCLDVFELKSQSYFICGIIIGIIGILIVSINYPIYKRWLNSRKKHYAFDIIQLSKKITDENE